MLWKRQREKKKRDEDCSMGRSSVSWLPCFLCYTFSFLVGPRVEAGPGLMAMGTEVGRSLCSK